jgi:hypothetical protein
MKAMKKYFSIALACILGFLIGISYSIINNNAHASWGNTYKKVRDCIELISFGKQGWEYKGLGRLVWHHEEGLIYQI